MTLCTLIKYIYIYYFQDNILDFREYVAVLHLVLRGKGEDKRKWSFKVYDRDGDGQLDKQEMAHVIKVILMSL